MRGEDSHARVMINLRDSFQGAVRQITLRVPVLTPAGDVIKGNAELGGMGEATWLVNTTIAMKFSLGEVANRPQLHTLIATFLGYAKAGTANAAIGC
jgi:hypothetical protein